MNPDKSMGTKEIEWSAVGGGKLNIPKEKLTNQIYGWSSPKPVNLSGTCASWTSKDGVTTLLDAFIDTSDRVEGITMVSRITQRRELILIGQSVVIFPIEPIEK